MLTKLRQLAEHQGFMKYFKNTSWLFGEKILRMIVGLFVGVWVARYLGPEQFGLFSYAQSFVGLFTAIATLGLDSIIVRELVKDASRRDELIGTAFWLKVMGSFIVLFLLAIAVTFTSNDNDTNMLVFIIASTTLFQAFNVIDFYFQANVLSRYVVFANMISLFISSLIKVVFILYEAPLLFFAWLVLFDSLILAMGFIYFYFKCSTNQRFYVHFDKSIAIVLLKDSWPLILSGIVISIYMKIDQVMIMEMMDAEAVGQYAAAVRISEAWYFIPVVVTSSLFPAIVNAKKMSEELYYERLQKLYNFMVLLSLFVALPLTFLSDFVIVLLYGEEYKQAGSVLMIHVWAGIFVSLGVARGNWLVAENLQSLSFYFIGIAGIVNVVGNLIFIPLYGIKAAALTTLISYGISVIVVPFFIGRTKISVMMLLRAFMLLKIK